MNTTHTSEPIEQKEKQKATRLLDELDLRDYFAAKAMQALIHDEAAEPDCGSLTEWWADVDEKLIGPERFAVAAYMMADAMLRAREGTYD